MIVESNAMWKKSSRITAVMVGVWNRVSLVSDGLELWVAILVHYETHDRIG